MAIQITEHQASTESPGAASTNGTAMAAFTAAGFGAFAMGLVVALNEAGVLSPPALYGPAGGVSGRTTLAVVLWLVAWALLHRRWRSRQLDSRRIWALMLFLIAVGIAGTFPPLWGLL